MQTVQQMGRNSVKAGKLNCSEHTSAQLVTREARGEKIGTEKETGGKEKQRVEKLRGWGGRTLL